MPLSEQRRGVVWRGWRVLCSKRRTSWPSSTLMAAYTVGCTSNACSSLLGCCGLEQTGQHCRGYAALGLSSTPCHLTCNRCPGRTTVNLLGGVWCRCAPERGLLPCTTSPGWDDLVAMGRSLAVDCATAALLVTCSLQSCDPVALAHNGTCWAAVPFPAWFVGVLFLCVALLSCVQCVALRCHVWADGVCMH
jgi:hypothetical protein